MSYEQEIFSQPCPDIDKTTTNFARTLQDQQHEQIENNNIANWELRVHI